eukprot:g6215.t1
MAKPLDRVYKLQGKVVKGFGRGSKLLGCPTANLDPNAFNTQLAAAPRGVYYGWASINAGPVCKSVLSLGYNPQFSDMKHETVEAYLMHEFKEDFYGANMKLIICGYIRPQEKYDSMEALKQAIQNDIEVGAKALDKDPAKQYAADPIFQTRQEADSRGGVRKGENSAGTNNGATEDGRTDTAGSNEAGNKTGSAKATL